MATASASEPATKTGLTITPGHDYQSPTAAITKHIPYGAIHYPQIVPATSPSIIYRHPFKNSVPQYHADDIFISVLPPECSGRIAQQHKRKQSNCAATTDECSNHNFHPYQQCTHNTYSSRNHRTNRKFSRAGSSTNNSPSITHSINSIINGRWAQRIQNHRHQPNRIRQSITCSTITPILDDIATPWYTEMLPQNDTSARAYNFIPLRRKHRYCKRCHWP